MIYLDNAATTMTDPKVVEAMLPWFSDYFGNAGSSHGFGRYAAEAIKKARSDIAEVVGCLPEEIIFTSGGTEADNLALHMAIGCRTTAIEHKAVLETLGYKAQLVFPDKYGAVNPDDFKFDGTFDTVSIMAVNNETGVLQPYEEVARRLRRDKRTKLIHVDAVQAFGHRPIDIKNIDLMSVSAHKFNGPKGIGFLYARKDKQWLLFPTQHGGGQEFGLRSGTEAVPLIIGLAEAVRQHSNPSPLNLGWLEDRLVTECDAVINGSSCHDDPWKRTINFQLDVHNDTMLQLLSKKEIYLSAGSACNAHSSVPSHVLKAMGLTDEQCNRSIRLSVGDGITTEEADTLIKEINRIRKELAILSEFN